MERDPRYVDHVLAPRYAFACREEFPYLIEILVAHTLMLRRQRILSDEAAGATVRALTAITAERLPPYDPQIEDLYFVIERLVAATTCGAGDFRPALSRNDTWATLARMMLRDQVLDLIGALDDLRDAVIAQAAQHRTTVMMAHTHHQHAQPTTVAHYLLAADAVIGRCVARYRDALERLDRSPMGAGALTTTGFPIDRAYTASLLGFLGPVDNSYDAVSAADHVAELAGCHGVLATSLSRIVQDLILWASSEIGALELAPGFVQISSIMPQKRNPVALEHVRSDLSRLLGTSLEVWAAAHNVPFGDVNDPIDNLVPPLTDAHRSLNGTVGLLRAAVASATVQPEAWAQALHGTFATSTELADTLVREGGLRFPQAHAAVTRIVAERRARGEGLTGIGPEEVEAAVLAATGRPVRLSAETISRAVDPRHFVSRRNVRGGPGSEAVAAMLAAARESLAASREESRAVRDRLEAARKARAEGTAAGPGPRGGV
jgi:argininosuccinate lyase